MSQNNHLLILRDLCGLRVLQTNSFLDHRVLRGENISAKKIHTPETFETNVTTANPVSQGLTPSLSTTYNANVTKPKNGCLTVTFVSNCNIL